MNKKKLREYGIELIKAGGSIGTAITQAHPVTVALMAMFTAKMGLILAGEKQGYVHHQLDRIYVDSLTLGGIAATVPVVTGGLGLVQSYLASRGGAS